MVRREEVTSMAVRLFIMILRCTTAAFRKDSKRMLLVSVTIQLHNAICGIWIRPTNATDKIFHSAKALVKYGKTTVQPDVILFTTSFIFQETAKRGEHRSIGRRWV